jgi:hypothetical protein
VTGARIVFVVGLFIVPLVLLAMGHDLRKRPARQRGTFWGAASGYFAGVLVTAVLTVMPPVHWSAGSPPRDLAVHFSMVAGTILGAMAGSFLRRARAPVAPGERP